MDLMDPAAFGARLRRIRLKKGLTLAQTTELTGISTAYLSDMERGKRGSPTAQTLTKLADAFDVSVDEILGRNSGTPRVPAWIERVSPEWQARLAKEPELANLVLRLLDRAKQEQLPPQVLERLLEKQIESMRILEEMKGD